MMNVLGFAKKNISIKLEWKIFALFNVTAFFIRNINGLFVRDEVDFGRARDFFVYPDKNLKVTELKKSLDPESVELVNELMGRQEYIYTHNLLSMDKFGENEKKLQKSIDVKKYKKLYPELKSFPCETFFYHNGLKFVPRDILEKIKGRDVIDAGGFIGDSAIVFSAEYNFGNIYSFEPEENNLKQLEGNVKRYGARNVKVEKNGLGKSAEMVYMSSGGLGATIGREANDRDRRIALVSIDDFSAGNDLNIGLIKMDIEGAEYDAILGARETILSMRPVLLISIYHTAKDFFEIKTYIEELNPEYRLMVRKINPFSLANETILIAY